VARVQVSGTAGTARTAAVRRAAVAVLALLVLLPAAVSAHCPPGQPGLGEHPCPLDAPRWTGSLAVLGVNGVLGGLTAGVAQHVSGGSFRDGFTRGFLGGAIIHGGKWIAAERFPGAGLLGREVAALGVSVVDNAGAGRGTFDRVVLPLWVGRLYIERDAAGGRARLTPRVDLMATFWTAHGLIEDELRLDVRSSLSGGTPVFRTDNQLMRFGGNASSAGAAAAGVIFLSDIPAYGEHWGPRVFAHERVHMLQMDQIFLKWTRPAERAAVGAIPGGDRLLRYADVNLSTELLRLLTLAFPAHEHRPWELEAMFLAR
jgi:hypothetical protein